jgi:hypothetical protein
MIFDNILQIALTIFELPLNIIQIPINHYQQKNKLRKSGYIVDPPLEYFLYPNEYSTYTRHFWSPTIYTKYGKTYTYEEFIRGDHKMGS